ncbi:MAG: peptidylprolyl isomerase [Acidobacteriia bacterium]|nr:peptidylprolyl isomerase [Terriglobia bacterium]
MKTCLLVHEVQTDVSLRVLRVLCGSFFFAGAVALVPVAASAQPTRLAILQAEDRRAATLNDLAILRSGARSGDPQTAQIGVRALGRLERPSLIPDIVPALRHPLPEVRAEAANAIGQAAQGWKKEKPPTAAAMDAVVAPLVARLNVEADAGVRAAICETIGRLPYTTAAQVETAERTLVDVAARSLSIDDRLGIAQGLEALVRLQRTLRAPSDEAIALLRQFAGRSNDGATGARVRRLSLEALITASATTANVRRAASRDPDAQMRRLAMRAAATMPPPEADGDLLKIGLADPSPLVRMEALRGLQTVAATRDAACTAAAAATADPETQVALFALDQLAPCRDAPDAIARLVSTVNDLSNAGAPRSWHRAAHALVALATADAGRAAAALPQFTGSRIWQLRMYAARAAATLKNRDVLVALAKDDDDNVREAAVEGLRKIAGHDADEIYIAELARPGNQIVRVAALALDGTPQKDQAVAALKMAWQRLVAESRDNSHDARDAIAKTLASLGIAPAAGRGPTSVGPGSDRGRTLLKNLRTSHNDLTAEDLRRLAAPRARVTIRGAGTFELALFTMQAPATVLRFVHLAESGYYNGLTFHRIVPNFVIQGGSPGANEYIGDVTFMRDEVGLWPHVRGAVGISTRGRDTGDAQIFVDLIDNPRLDHEYTVFAQVLNGMDVVDQVLEGDVIDKIEIVIGQ